MKKLIAGIAAIALTFAFSIWGLNMLADEGAYPLCENEDSVGCIWDAQVQGNGAGLSFVTSPEGEVTYLP